MKIKVECLISKPTAEYPYNYRVEFDCDSFEVVEINRWINTNKLPGLSWEFSLSSPKKVFYTTKQVATLCGLKWSA